MTAQVQLDDSQRIFLCGPIEFDNMRRIKAEAEHLVRASTADPIECNCQQLKVANSLCVALLIALIRAATGAGKHIKFSGISQDLIGIIDFSGMSGVVFDNAK